jgi:hypothetical protein
MRIQNLACKPERKRTLERSRCRWDDYNRRKLREIGREVVDWINLPQDGDQ